jgi:hypothetical protein
MVIEYIGEVIRTELSELREKLYEARVSHVYNGRYGTPCCCMSLKFIDWRIGRDWDAIYSPRSLQNLLQSFVPMLIVT